jgi:hypothetical protein
MQPSDVIRGVRAILAAGCLVAGSVCIGAGHAVAGAAVEGKHFVSPDAAVEAYFAASKWLFIFGAVLFVCACVLALLAMLPARRAAA